MPLLFGYCFVLYKPISNNKKRYEPSEALFLGFSKLEHVLKYEKKLGFGRHTEKIRRETACSSGITLKAMFKYATPKITSSLGSQRIQVTTNGKLR